MTAIVGMALGHRPIPNQPPVAAHTANFLLNSSSSAAVSERESIDVTLMNSLIPLIPICIYLLFPLRLQQLPERLHFLSTDLTMMSHRLKSPNLESHQVIINPLKQTFNENPPPSAWRYCWPPSARGSRSSRGAEERPPPTLLCSSHFLSTGLKIPIHTHTLFFICLFSLLICFCSFFSFFNLSVLPLSWFLILPSPSFFFLPFLYTTPPSFLFSSSQTPRRLVSVLSLPNLVSDECTQHRCQR